MKHITRLATIITALLVASHAAATPKGPYIGIGAGQGRTQTIDKYIFNTSGDPNGSQGRTRSGFAGRAFIGYNFNKFVGLELGYAKYNKAQYTGTAFGATSTLRYYFHTYELILKGYLPLGDSGFNLYALAGAAHVVETTNFTNNNVQLNSNLYPPTTGTNHFRHNRPEYGLGINYVIAKKFTLAAEATQIQAIGSKSTSPSALPALNLFSLNFAYYIT